VCPESIRPAPSPAAFPACQGVWERKIVAPGDRPASASETGSPPRPERWLTITAGYLDSRTLPCLWPDANGDSAYKSFKIAVSRLHQLVGNDAVMYQGGKDKADK